jgi:hypothetical protein
MRTEIQNENEFCSKPIFELSLSNDIGWSLCRTGALPTKIQEGTNYVKFKFKENANIPDNGLFEYGDVVPWFDKSGLGDQVKSSQQLKNLLDETYIEIIEQLEFKDGKWIKNK